VTITVAPPLTGAAVEVAPVPGREVAASVAAAVGALVAVAASVGALVAMAASVGAEVAVGWTAGACEHAAKIKARAVKILKIVNRENLMDIIFSSYFCLPSFWGKPKNLPASMTHPIMAVSWKIFLA
jgi:hypothetical protein